LQNLEQNNFTYIPAANLKRRPDWTHRFEQAFLTDKLAPRIAGRQSIDILNNRRISPIAESRAEALILASGYELLRREICPELRIVYLGRGIAKAIDIGSMELQSLVRQICPALALGWR
jgi:hypothetical protein